jgi:choline dehydrogenase-like flavoprotein
LSGQLVEKIELEQGRAVGVRLGDAAAASSEGASQLVKAREAVVLSAGSIKTPHLLLLSGIGDEAQLTAHGIPCEHHLPVRSRNHPGAATFFRCSNINVLTDGCVRIAQGVGQNLMDHACFSLGFECDKPGVSLDYLGQPLHKLAVGVRYLLGLGGPVASNIWEAGGVVYGNAHKHLSHPNLQYHFAPILAEDKYDGAHMQLKPGFQMQIDQLRPHSRGHVTLRSADPRDDPASLFNYFQDPRDMAEMVTAFVVYLFFLVSTFGWPTWPFLVLGSKHRMEWMRACRSMRTIQRWSCCSSRRWRRTAAAPRSPQRTIPRCVHRSMLGFGFGLKIGPSNDSQETDADIEQFIRANSGTDYHPSGT